MKLIVSIVALALATPALAQQQNIPGKEGHIVRGPSIAIAVEGSMAAIDSCKAQGYFVGATVVDDEGGIRASLTGDGSPTEGPNGSRRKAVLSALQKASGSELAERAKADPALAAQWEANKDWLARAGSLLIMQGGKVIGAIGVEGNPHDLAKDVSCAQAGLDKIEARLK
jgi:uncharacterized protein GlcG (DUF336 family)